MYIKEIEKIVSKDKIYENELMSNYTSFKIGGPAEYLIKIQTPEELKEILKIIKNQEVPLTRIGNGSNLLVSDSGIKGIVLKIEINTFELNTQTAHLRVGSGVKLGFIAQKCLKNELAGFEFASGIPGTIGGAIRMNAGAHGKEMKDVITSVTYMDRNGDVFTIQNKEARFEYKKGEKSKTSNSLFDDEMPFTDYFINFSNYAKERGINIEPNSLRQLIAGIGSSKIMFIKSKNKELANSILKLLSEYLGSQFYSDVANDNWTNLSDLKWRVENGLYYETAFFQGIEAAISDYKAISIIGLENVDVNTMNSYFEPFLKYANEPNLDNYVTIANPTRKVTDSYKLTNNIWFAIFAKSNDFELPIEYAQTSVVVELNAVEVEKSEELSENKFKFIPFTRFNECLLEDEDNNTISEDLWKKVDALDDYITRVAKFRIENKLFIQLEKYVTAYILCKGDKNDALDNCILNKLLPILKTLEFKISEGSEDEDLLATVDNIFGLENLNKSQEYLRKINQEKF